METILIALALVVLAFLGSPIFAVIGAIGLIAFHSTGTDSSAMIVELFRIASAPTLLAIPLFTFAGYMLAESRTPRRLVGLSEAFLGWIPGGVAVVTLASCAIFTAFTGASGVTIIALGGLLYPILREQKYSEEFSLGLLTTSGSLGLLFPPSLPLILYGMVASNARSIGGSAPDVSIDKLFIAGILPGILLIVLLSVYSVRKNVRTATIPFSWRKALAEVRASIWELPLPVLILGGIYGGYFTRPRRPRSPWSMSSSPRCSCTGTSRSPATSRESCWKVSCWSGRSWSSWGARWGLPTTSSTPRSRSNSSNS